MFEVTDRALEMIKKFQEGSEGPRSIRILMTEGGWKGPYLVMALDNQKEDDQVFTVKDVTFLVAKSLLDQVKPITVDYVESALGPGYTLKSGLLKDLGGICSSICESC